MKPFKTHTGVVAILNRENVDTDQIISKEFLKSIKRTGFGEQLFHHWKYLENGELNPVFELNQPEFKDASILIAGNNFGCGSSREHAVWAVYQAGFRVVLAPSKQTKDEIIPGFADIFKNNSAKNGLLLLEFSEQEILQMHSLVQSQPGLKATLDLPSEKIGFHLSDQTKNFSFKIDPGLKERFLEGLDDIGLTEKLTHQIDEYEKYHCPKLV